MNFCKRSIVAVLFACFLACGLAKTGSIQIPKNTALNALNSQAKLMKVFLDTMGPFKNSGTDSASWFYDGSYVQLPTGSRIGFPIPRIRVTGVTRRYELFVNDFSTDSIQFSRQGSLWRLRITGKNNEKALMVGCINRISDKPCAVHVLNHKAAIRNFYIHLDFTIAFQGSQVTLVPKDVFLDFDYKIHSLLLGTVARIVDYFVNIKAAARKAVKDKVLDELKKDSLKKYLSVDLNELIYDQIFGFLPSDLAEKASFIKNEVKLLSISELTNHFKITFSYPNIVTAATVQGIEFRPVIEELTRTCPYNYGFRAKVKTAAKVSGTGYIAFLDGARGPTFNWAMNGAGEQTSIVGYPIDGNPGQLAKSGFARLVLKYKGFPNKEYVKYSPFTKVVARCRKDGGGVIGTITSNTN